jgi:hypothetical protein
MSAREITLMLPEALYEQLAAQAQSDARGLDDVITQALIQQFAIVPESELPSSLQAELRTMAGLSDDALWAIARSDANPDKVALYDLLTDRQIDGTLTAEGIHLLQQLRDELEAVTLRKAQAFALLRSRGVELPSLDELRSASR